MRVLVVLAASATSIVVGCSGPRDVAPREQSRVQGDEVSPSAVVVDAPAPGEACEPPYLDAGAPPEPPDHQEEDAERLVVADGLDGTLRVLDLAEERIVGTFDVGRAPTVYTGPTGRYVYIVDNDRRPGTVDRVRILDGALLVVDHGDHVHHERHTPEVIDGSLEGENPIHFTAHGDKVAVFFDDEGVAEVVDEHALSTTPFGTTTVAAGLPHHGAVVPLGDAFLATYAERPDGASRASIVGVRVHDASGTPTDTRFATCPGLHGEAAKGSMVAFGCSDGVLVVSEALGTYVTKKIPNPTAPEGARRVGTLVAHPEAGFFVGNYGADTLARVDVTGTGAIHPFAVGPYIGFAFDAHGRDVLVLGKDGALRTFDPQSGAERGQPLAVTTAPTDHADHGRAYPQMVVGASAVYVTNPQAGEVVLLRGGAIAKRFPIPGVPTKLARVHFGAGHAGHH